MSNAYTATQVAYVITSIVATIGIWYLFIRIYRHIHHQK